MSKTTPETQPAPQPDAELAANRDLSDAELANVDGGFGVLSVAGRGGNRRPPDSPAPINPFTEA